MPGGPRFVINPVAGGGSARKRIPALEAALRHAGFEPDVVFTRHEGHGYELARHAIDDGCETIVAAGGDGTVNEVANAILDASANDRVRIGTIALGTGKDIARCLGLTRGATAIRSLLRGHERRIDVGKIDLHDASGAATRRYFLVEASAGWAPEIAQAVPRPLKRLGDTAPYILTTFAKMLGPMGRPFTLTIDGARHDGPYNSVSIHNLEYWGDLLAAPGARPDDGLLDVIRWSDMGRRAVVQALRGQQRGGTHLAMDGIDRHVARTVELGSEKRTSVDTDGELAGYLPATVGIVPGALRFLVP